MNNMTDFNEYFEKQGSLYLNNISYNLLTLEKNPEHVKISIFDDLDTEIINENTQLKLKVVFTRTIKHNPEVLFNLNVSFGAIYTFKNAFIDSKLDEIDFKKMLKKNSNRLFLNIISRASQLISEITSSHGQQPLVTPPIFLKQSSNS